MSDVATDRLFSTNSSETARSRLAQLRYEGGVANYLDVLDAQRSLYSKDKESRERKAEAPRPYKPPKAPPVLRPDLMRPAPTPQRRQDLGSSELPLDYEAITRAYLERLRR